MRDSFKNIWVVSAFFFIVGTLITSIFEAGILLFFLPYLFLIATGILFLIFRVYSKESIAGFLLYFSVNIFWIGISALFRNYFSDYSQNESDAFFFYQMSTKDAIDSKLNELVLTSEGAFAIYVWVFVYRFFDFIGFEQTPTIGIIFNSWLLAIGCVIGVSIVKLIYQNIEISKRFFIFYSLCAIYWLFGSVHIRDSFVVLLTIIQLFFTINYLTRRTTYSFLVLVVTTIISTLFFPFLRTEFYFIPILFFAGSILIPLFLKTKNKNTSIILLLFVIGISTISVLLFSGYADMIFAVLERGQKGYLEEIAETASSSSLGVKLIIDQPLILRLIFGAFYVHIYPIPFWYGFKTDTIYDLFKSLNLFFLWSILPLVYIGLRQLKQYEQTLKEIMIFCISVYLILVLAIAGTSLETRHLSVFFVPLLIIAVKPNLKDKNTNSLYKNILSKILLVVVVIHIAWIGLKFIL